MKPPGNYAILPCGAAAGFHVTDEILPKVATKTANGVPDFTQNTGSEDDLSADLDDASCRDVEIFGRIFL